MELAPFAGGEASLILLSAIVEFTPPPGDCAGGVSNVVPFTITRQGVVAEPVAARQVAASLTITFGTSTEVIARKSTVARLGAGLAQD